MCSRVQIPKQLSSPGRKLGSGSRFGSSKLPLVLPVAFDDIRSKGWVGTADVDWYALTSESKPHSPNLEYATRKSSLACSSDCPPYLGSSSMTTMIGFL